MSHNNYLEYLFVKHTCQYRSISWSSKSSSSSTPAYSTLIGIPSAPISAATSGCPPFSSSSSSCANMFFLSSTFSECALMKPAPSRALSCYLCFLFLYSFSSSGVGSRSSSVYRISSVNFIPNWHFLIHGASGFSWTFDFLS